VEVRPYLIGSAAQFLDSPLDSSGEFGFGIDGIAAT